MDMRVGVIGAGTMGVGIVYVFAAAGCPVTVVEPAAERQRGLRETLRRVGADGVRRGRLDAAVAAGLADSVKIIAAVADLPTGLDLIIESVPEIPDLKSTVLKAVEDREPTTIASNTSSLSIDVLAGSLRDPSRFIGMHFFNPVWSLPLVELVRGAATSEATLAQAERAVTVIGKQAAVVNDRPGFATSRLDLIAALEAIRMVEQGVGSPADIDRAIRLAYRHPVGPLQLSDIVGLDVRLDIARSLQVSLGDRFAPPALLEAKVAAGELGQKSGRGFYEWDESGVVVDG